MLTENIHVVNLLLKDSTMGSVTNQQIAVDVPVLIVGGGPTGLLAAYLLSKFKGTRTHKLGLTVLDTLFTIF